MSAPATFIKKSLRTICSLYWGSPQSRRLCGERRSDGVNERRRVKPHEKDIICFSEVRVEPSHPRKRLVASRSVASAFTSEQQRRSATFFGEETQRNERAGDFY